MSQRSLIISYCSNYNGVNIGFERENEHPEWQETWGDDADQRFVQLANSIIDHAADDCTDDGLFIGDEEELEDYSIEQAVSIFGNEFKYKFDIDDIST